MQNWILELVNQFGYAGVAFLIAVENIFPPIPSEVILTFGGFLTTYTSLEVWPVIVASTIGSLVGALILYGAGRICSAKRLERWMNGKAGQILHLNPSDVQNAREWFERKGKTTVFFCRFIPIIRSLISIPAGMTKMALPPFLVLTATGSALWNTALVWLGAAAGASWKTIAGYFGTYSKAAFVVLIGTALVLAAACVIRRYILNK